MFADAIVCTIPVNIMCVRVSAAICRCEHYSNVFLALLFCFGMACSNCLQQIVLRLLVLLLLLMVSDANNVAAVSSQ